MTKLLSVFSLMWDDRYPATHITDNAKTPVSKTGCFGKHNVMKPQSSFRCEHTALISQYLFI